MLNLIVGLTLGCFLGYFARSWWRPALTVRTSWQRADVLEFHQASEQPIAPAPCCPDVDTLTLRARLIAEETQETLHALGCEGVAVNFTTPNPKHFDLVEVADGCADLKYVTLGTEIVCGIPSADVWDEVHLTNMAKFKHGILRDSRGKVIKPPGWTPPDIAGVLKKHATTEEQEALKP